MGAEKIGAIERVENRIFSVYEMLNRIYDELDTLTDHVVRIDNRNDEFHKALLGKLNTIIRQLSHKTE